MDWRWTARRLLISAFLVVHVGATILWVIPRSHLKDRTIRVVAAYMLPLGLWQYWTMFAPDPVRYTFALEAEVIDAQGLRYGFAFPRLAGYNAVQAIPRFRYSKYAANLADESFNEPRVFAARHVARSLNLAADRFPIDVHLFYQIRDAPPIGGPPSDPMAPTRQSLIATFHFEKISEVRP
jgi:hypothetical protein